MDNIEKKFILCLNENHQKLFVVDNQSFYYLTYNPNDATRFNAIGDAMKKSVEIQNKDGYLFQVISIF